MPYVMPQDLRTSGISGYYAKRDFPVPYSSLPPARAEPMLSGGFVPAPNVISSHDLPVQPENLSGTFVETQWVHPPFRSSPQAPLGMGQVATDVAGFIDRYKWPIGVGAVVLLALAGGRRRKLF